MKNDIENFSGTKIACLHGNKILVYRRDDIPSIPFPDHWDLPGGGREGDETPEECGLRELEEEFGLTLTLDRITWLKRYPASSSSADDTIFAVLMLESNDVDQIQFGDEGQFWKLMHVREFFEHKEVQGQLQNRLADYFDALKF